MVAVAVGTVPTMIFIIIMMTIMVVLFIVMVVVMLLVMVMQLVRVIVVVVMSVVVRVVEFGMLFDFLNPCCGGCNVLEVEEVRVDKIR